MTKQEEIARFLDAHCALPRMVLPYNVHGYPRHRAAGYGHPYHQQRPTVEDLAEELLAEPEFLALRLGSLLGTPQGHVIAEGVKLVTPPFYEADVELLVAGLTYAAELQAKGNQRAGLVALGVVGVFTALLFGFGRGGAQAA